jgi:hypothetical protein
MTPLLESVVMSEKQGAGAARTAWAAGRAWLLRHPYRAAFGAWIVVPVLLTVAGFLWLPEEAPADCVGGACYLGQNVAALVVGVMLAPLLVVCWLVSVTGIWVSRNRVHLGLQARSDAREPVTSARR